MSKTITIFLIAVSLSMDAFSLSLAYGMSKINTNSKLTLTLVVGIYHFIMPLLGLLISNLILEIPFLNIDIIALIILLITGIDLIIAKDKTLKIGKLDYLMFGLSVSLDSFSVGIGLRAITDNYILSSLTFSLTSVFFTYLGLSLGSTIGNKIGDYSQKIGGIILIIIAIICFIR